MDAETVVRCIYGAGKFAAIDDLIIDCLDIMARLENHENVILVVCHGKAMFLSKS